MCAERGEREEGRGDRLRSGAVAPRAARRPRDARPRPRGSAGGRAGLAPRWDAAELNRTEFFGLFYFFLERRCLCVCGFGVFFNDVFFFFEDFVPLVLKRAASPALLSRASCAENRAAAPPSAEPSPFAFPRRGVMLKAGPDPAHPALEKKKPEFPAGRSGNSAPRRTRTDGAGGGCTGAGAPWQRSALPGSLPG